MKSAPGDETDSLLLRRGLALHDLHADAKEPAALLGARFDAMTQRGDPLHLREEVRYRVAFDPSATPEHLLDLAVRNYGIQKEPWDARVLLEACVRVGHRAPCDAVTASTASFEHPRIRALRAQLATVTP